MVYNNGFSVKILTNNDQDKLKRNDYNYVALYNNTEYELQLINDRHTDAMAEVFIEGENIGTWFIPATDNIIINRPSNISKKFTFFRETDPRAIGAGTIPGESLNGLVRVVFYPKKRYMTITTVKNLPSYYENQNVYIEQTPFNLQKFPTIPKLSSSPQISSQSTTLPQISSQSITLPQISSQSSGIAPISPRKSLTYQSGTTVLGRKSHQTFDTMMRFSKDEIDWDNKTEISIRLIIKSDSGTFISTIESSSPHMIQKQFISIKRSTNPPRID